jgi:soluble lytic murein transglycosylase-like protein
VLFLLVIIMSAGLSNALLPHPVVVGRHAKDGQSKVGSTTRPALPSHPADQPHTANNARPADQPHAASQPRTTDQPAAAAPSQSQPSDVQQANGAATSYVDVARQAASSVGINGDLFVRQIQQESQFNPGAVSAAGAIGIAQFMPATAAQYGIDPHDPVQSLNAAARYMANFSSAYGGDYAKALAAYNAGPGAVDYAVSMGGSNWIAYLPAETQNYINVILY